MGSHVKILKAKVSFQYLKKKAIITKVLIIMCCESFCLNDATEVHLSSLALHYLDILTSCYLGSSD